MTIEDFLTRLDGVKRTGRGWQAKCPAHDDRSPSLSIREGELGVLLHCFAGCSLNTICEALGLMVRDLFYSNEQDSRAWRKASRAREADRRAREQAQRKRGLGIDVAREAEQLIRAASTIDISHWSDDVLDRALSRLASAYTVLHSEGALYERG
jgi:hypothetical protein